MLQWGNNCSHKLDWSDRLKTKNLQNAHSFKTYQSLKYLFSPINFSDQYNPYLKHQQLICSKWWHTIGSLHWHCHRLSSDNVGLIPPQASPCCCWWSFNSTCKTTLQLILMLNLICKNGFKSRNLTLSLSLSLFIFFLSFFLSFVNSILQRFPRSS